MNASAILKFDKVNTAGLFDPCDGTDPSGGDVLQDHADLDVDGLRTRTPCPRPVAMRVVVEDVAAVRI